MIKRAARVALCGGSMRAAGFGGKPSSSVAGADSAREALQHFAGHCPALSTWRQYVLFPDGVKTLKSRSRCSHVHSAES